MQQKSFFKVFLFVYLATFRPFPAKANEIYSIDSNWFETFGDLLSNILNNDKNEQNTQSSSASIYKNANLKQMPNWISQLKELKSISSNLKDMNHFDVADIKASFNDLSANTRDGLHQKAAKADLTTKKGRLEFQTAIYKRENELGEKLFREGVKGIFHFVKVEQRTTAEMWSNLNRANNVLAEERLKVPQITEKFNQINRQMATIENEIEHNQSVNMVKIFVQIIQLRDEYQDLKVMILTLKFNIDDSIVTLHNNVNNLEWKKMAYDLLEVSFAIANVAYVAYTGDGSNWDKIQSFAENQYHITTTKESMNGAIDKQITLTKEQIDKLRNVLEGLVPLEERIKELAKKLSAAEVWKANKLMEIQKSAERLANLLLDE